MEETLDRYIESLPIDSGAKRRVRITVACADCADIPKVPSAGEVLDGPDGRYQLMHNGVKVVEGGYHGQWMTEVIRILRGHHEPQEEKAFHDVLRHVPANATMIEMGSFWAYYSLWFHQQIPGAKTYLIEPDPHNLEIGKRNYALNGRTGEFFHFSLGRQARDPEPFVCGSDGANRSVPMISVDAFLKLVGQPYVDVLHSDIQGAETEMLEGASDSIEQGKIRFAVISTHHHAISGDALTHQKCLKFLHARGAHILVEHSVAESFSGDGLIVASFRPEDRQIPPIQISWNRASNGLFRELDYDLHDAWQEIRRLKGTA